MRYHYKIPLVKPSLPALNTVYDDLDTIITSGRLSNFGPFVAEFEASAREFLGVPYAVSVSSATTGLCLLLNMLPRGSEVIVPSFTFLATVQAILWNGLRPRFVDIDPGTYSIDPESACRAINTNTSAILAVNAFGGVCPVRQLEEISRSHGIPLYFDSAHAFGSKFGGRYFGSFGSAEVFSFSPTKVLPSFEGGLVTTRSEQIRDGILARRNYGFSLDGGSKNLGLNGKMTEVSAVFCNKGLSSVTSEVECRNQVAAKYIGHLKGFSGIAFQHIPKGYLFGYKDFTILIDPTVTGLDRCVLQSQLQEKGIETGVYFSPPAHSLTICRQYAKGAVLTNTEAVAGKILSLPIYSRLTDSEIEYVTSAIEEALAEPVKVLRG